MSAAVELRPLAEEHLPGVAAMLGDPDVMRFTRVPVPVPDGFERTWLESYEEGRRADTREAFAALDAEGELLGMALAARAGYLREGVMRSTYLKGETRVDCGLWSRLVSDP